MKSLTTLILSCCTFYAQGLTIELSPEKDNTLYETNTIALSNGAGDYFFVGRTNQVTNDLRRGLLSFDVSSIPPGSTINQVSLEITASKTIAGEQNISIHQALTAWGESTTHANGEEGTGSPAEAGDATWTNAFHQGAAWVQAGGDFNPIPLATQSINGLTTISFNAVSLTENVQSWVDTPEINFGWILLGDESTFPTVYRFNSKENSNTTTRPKLIIDYALPQVVLTPDKDNTLFETNDGSISNGAGDKLFFGKPNNGLLRRGVLEFDVSNIPVNANITSVSLDLTVIDIPNSAQSGTAALHLAFSEWGASSSNGNGQGAPSQTGDATWIHTFFNTDLWNTAGGDFSPTASATSDFTNLTNNIHFANTTELIADVSTWIQDSNTNHGWVLTGDEINTGNVRSIGSLENSLSENRPTLTVTYFVPIDLIFKNGFE